MVLGLTRGRVSVVSAPASDVVSLSEIKSHLRVDGTHDDLLLAPQIRAAVDEIDTPRGWLGRSLVTRTLRLTLDELPGDAIELPGPPVTAVSSLTYRDEDDVWHTMTSTDYLTDLTAEPALLWVGDDGWPSDMIAGLDCVRIQYVAGYASGALVPQAIRQWIMVRVGEMYRDREASAIGTIATRLQHADRSLDAWRVYR